MKTSSMLGCTLCSILLATAPAAGQQPPPPPPPDTVVADTMVADTMVADTAVGWPSPRGAMIRSFLVPGWGQASTDSYGRGAVFFTIRGSSVYMLLRTMARLNEAREVEARLVGIATDSLNTLIAEATAEEACLADPVACEAAKDLAADTLAFEDAVGEHQGVATLRGLVESREDQRQDWIAYLLFFTLMDGVDAYVNRHLKGFPVGISSTPRRDGGFAFAVHVRTPW
ncbi:MAG: DUF5683 domain-containing protein [Longimicrobiales bacterium]